MGSCVTIWLRRTGRRRQHNITHMLYMLNNYGYRHTLRMSNTYYFFTATVVTWTPQYWVCTYILKSRKKLDGEKYIACLGENEKYVLNICKKLWRNGRPLERDYCGWKNNTDIDLKENTVKLWSIFMWLKRMSIVLSFVNGVLKFKAP